jgi:radical SAM protein with 4Fe4S-binding SPASM domain
LNLCGAGRVVCLIDPIGDVYACPFAIHDEFLAGNLREAGGFTSIWRESALFSSLREPQTGGACASCNFYGSCRGGCMAAKFFTGLPLDGPDPECVKGYGEEALAALGEIDRPRPGADHSRSIPLMVLKPKNAPVPACAEDPLAGFDPNEEAAVALSARS